MNPTPLSLLFAAVGVLIFFASAFGFIKPSKLISLVNTGWTKNWSMHAAIGARLILGIIFILAAPVTKFPLAFQIIGYAAIAAVVVLLFIGKDRIGRLLAWFEKLPPMLTRVWLLLGMAAGAFIVYSAT